MLKKQERQGKIQSRKDNINLSTLRYFTGNFMCFILTNIKYQYLELLELERLV